MRGPTEPLPSPRAHLAASLRLMDALIEQAGGAEAWPGVVAARRAIARPFALPASVRPALNGLKYDGYLTAGPDGPAWGIAFNERWEGAAIWATVRGLASALPGTYDLDRVEAIRAQLRSPSINVSLGFDVPGRAPRIKLYFQEADWSQGVLTAAGFARLSDAARRGCALPPQVPASQALAVLTVVLWPDGRSELKVYVGGASPAAAIACLGGASAEATALAAGLAEVCPSGDAWHYLTLRLGAGEPTYALNRIWDHVRVGFSDGDALESAWNEIGALFERAGRGTSLQRMRTMRAELGDLRLVPTAAAFERAGTSADVYVAAWPR